MTAPAAGHRGGKLAGRVEPEHREREMTTVTARAKAFGGEGIRTHRFAVDPDTGLVRVWDDVAGHYTACHSLSASATRRIRKLAETH